MPDSKTTKTLNDESYASNPGKVTLSPAKLKSLQPELFGLRGFGRLLASILTVNHPPMTHLKEHLAYGDSRAGVVVALDPLLVAAYTDELDCIAMLRFPKELAQVYQLSPGSKLLTVNLYKNAGTYDPDLILGPHMIKRWSGFIPLIADFLADNMGGIKQRKQEIEETEWQRTLMLGHEYLQKHPGVARDGRPTHSGTPVQLSKEVWRATNFKR